MDSVLHLLGIARKAGRVEVGEEPVGAAARAHQAKLILTACDGADNSLRRAAHFAETGKVPCLTTPYTKGGLGSAVGRSACTMLALTDVGLAAAIAAKLAQADPEGCGPAAQQLKAQAEKALQRQKEQRAHEKNLQKKNKKPWAIQSSEKNNSRPPRRAEGVRGGTGAPARGGMERSDACSAEHARPLKPFAPKGKLTIKKPQP